MKKIFYILAALLLFACEKVEKGSIYGTVFYKNKGEPVAAAIVTLHAGNDMFSEQTTVTGSDGYYFFDNVDAESIYTEIWAEKNGYKSEVIDVYITKGKKTKIDIPL